METIFVTESREMLFTGTEDIDVRPLHSSELHYEGDSREEALRAAHKVSAASRVGVCQRGFARFVATVSEITCDEDGVSTVCVERAAIGERDGKLLEPVDEMIGVRNAAYVVGCEVVPYLEAPIPRHRRDLTIDETCSLRCDLLAEIFGDAGKKRASRIRYEILGRVGRRHGKAGLHGGGLAILRLGKDAKIKRRGGYATKAMTATTHDFLPSDTLSQAQVSAKLSPREVQA